MTNANMLLDLYACPAQPTRWSHCLDEVCRRLNVRSAVVQRMRRSEHGLHQLWTARDSFSTAHADLHDRLVNNSENPRYDIDAIDPTIFGRVLRDDEYFANSSEAAVTRFRQRLDRASLGCAIGALQLVTGDEAISVMIHRDAEERRAFDSEEEGLLLELLPHIAQASQLGWQMLESTRRLEWMQAMADALAVGMVCLDRAGRVEWANHAAGLMLEDCSHLSLPQTRLRAVRAQDRPKLDQLCDGDNSGSVNLAVFGAGEPDEVQMLRVESRAGDEGTTTLLLAMPRMQRSAPLDAAAQMLGITKAEARVSTAILHGSSIADFARSRGLSEGGVRNQLKQVFAKTGLRRQSDVVGYLARSVTAFAQPTSFDGD